MYRYIRYTIYDTRYTTFSYIVYITLVEGVDKARALCGREGLTRLALDSSDWHKFVRLIRIICTLMSVCMIQPAWLTDCPYAHCCRRARAVLGLGRVCNACYDHRVREEGEPDEPATRPRRNLRLQLATSIGSFSQASSENSKKPQADFCLWLARQGTCTM